MTDQNKYLDFIDEQLEVFNEIDKWATKISNTEHDDIINDFNIGIFKLASLSFFKEHLDTTKCSCGSNAKEISYGTDIDRSYLIKKTLKKAYPDITKEITLKELLSAYFEEHKYCDFTFKCRKCCKKQRTKKDSTYTIDDKEYIKHKVPGDGHCFFHAIAMYLNLNVEELRNNVADYMEENKNDFIESYESEEHDNDTYEEFVENIRNTDEWADQLIIQALQKTVNRPIKVYREGRIHLGPDIHVTIESDNEPILVLYNDDNHYDALIEKSMDDSSETDSDTKSDVKYEQMTMANGEVLNLHLGSETSRECEKVKELTKDDLQSMKVPDIKKLLDLKDIKYNKKHKKTLLINQYLKGIIAKKNKIREEELSSLTNSKLKEILDEKEIKYDKKTLKRELIKLILESEYDETLMSRYLTKKTNN